jgi:lambda family phage portal protein
MNLLGWNLSISKVNRQPKPQPARRTYSAAAINRLLADWNTTNASADSELYGTIQTMRNRARNLEQDNEHIQRYLTLLENNVLGADGVKLQMKVADPNGTLDVLANRAIAAAWKEWSKRKYCTVTEDMCWREVEAMALKRPATDAGILVRKIPGFENKFRFAVQVLEIDHLDFDMNATIGDNEIRFGVEKNVWGKPVALHVLTFHPGDITQPSRRKRERIRIATTDILHIFWRERPGQTVGVPWYVSVMKSLKDLGRYEDAELIAACVAACKGGWFETSNPDAKYEGLDDGSGNTISDTEPGQWEQLPMGMKAVANNPTHPTEAFPEFVKARLRGIAGALGVSYNSLANDLESVNYSSMRAGRLDEVEEYKSVQSWLIENLHEPVFETWLEWSLMAGAIKLPNGSALPVSKFAKFNAASWKPRRWPWVDPLKDVQADTLAIKHRLKSRRQVIAEAGGDLEEVDSEIDEDPQLAGLDSKAIYEGNGKAAPPAQQGD